MGQAYLEPPQFNLEESYNDSNCCSPLIFILSAGSDPMSGLIRFASDRGISKSSVMTVSLGQGQVIKIFLFYFSNYLMKNDKNYRVLLPKE